MTSKIATTALLLLAACGGTEMIAADDLATSQSAALSVEAANQAGGFLALVADSTGDAATGIAAAQSAAQLTSQFTPAGCATATTSGNQVTYTFTACTGPYGMTKLTGTVIVQFSLAGLSSMEIEVASTGLLVGAATLDLSATATYDKGATTYTLTVASTTKGTSARAGAITQMGMYTITWDATCLQLDGTFSSGFRAETWSTAISGYERCSNQCPKAGGMVTVTGPNNRSVTISYSGGGTAYAMTSSGQSGMIALPCAD